MIRIDEEKCIGCGKCAEDCIAYNLIIEHNKARSKKECFLCGHCVAVCPVNAVSVEEYDMQEVKEYEKEKFELDGEILLNAVKFRRSIRNYKQQEVEREKLEKLVEIGRYTATAKNNQDTHFVLVQKDVKELKEKVWDYIEQIVPEKKTETPKELIPYASFLRRRKANPEDDYLFRNAPVVVFITSDWILDPGMAAQNMELMAVSLGLGTLYNGFLARIVDQSEEIKSWLGIEGKQVKGCMLAGYPNVAYKRTVPRKAANVIWK